MNAKSTRFFFIVTFIDSKQKVRENRNDQLRPQANRIVHWITKFEATC